MLNARHLLLIASFLFILPGACTNSGIAPASLDVSITASKFTVCPGGEFTYNVQICNFGSMAVTSIAVKDVLNQSLKLITVSPEPEDDGLWRISRLGPGECFTIMLVVRVPNYDAKFNGISGISGQGYVNINNHYSTISQSDDVYNLRNCVYVVAKGVSDLSTCVDVLVVDIAGTTLRENEHGSGSDYNRENIIGITSPEKGSIQYNTSLQAMYSPISIALPQSRTLRYNSRWTDDLKTNIQFTGGLITEAYRRANSIKKNITAQLSWNASALKTDSEFNGQGYLGYIHLLSPYELDPAMRINFERVKPSFEAREEYAGNFKIKAAIDTFDFVASSNKSASGTGLVSNDKRIGGTNQRTYEYGTGSYQIEESVRTSENYVAKDVQATYLPFSYSYRHGRVTNVSTKWNEGSWSLIEGVSLLAEEVSSADYFKKKSVVQWQTDLESEGNYSGRGKLKIFLNDEINQSYKVRLEEEYIGKYSVERKAHLQEMFGADIPHIYVRNDGRLVKDVTKNITVAKYSIIIINDGYTNLGPIYVKDVFPAGTQFLSSSVHPSRISSGYANWTFDSLLIGQSLRIDLNLNSTKKTSELVNRVSVSGGYNRRFVKTGNFSILSRKPSHRDKLNIMIYKMVKIDSIDPSRIAYRIAVENQDNRNIVARVTDIMPDGLMFINSSIEPENMTYNLSWIIMDLAPGETHYIDCLAQAMSIGQFVNRAHIDAYAIDGSGHASGDANVDINLSKAAFGNYSSEYGNPSEWKPPEWEFNYSVSIFNASSESACGAGGACPLNTYEEDEGFKNIYGRDSGSNDIYGIDYGEV